VKIIAVDSQKLSAIQTCQYKYDLSFNRNAVAVEKPMPLERGDLTHTILETYYNLHRYIDRWPRDFSITQVRKILTRVAENHATRLNLSCEESDAIMHVVINQYLDYYWGERAQTLAVEQVASKVMYADENLTIVYDAKIDWIISLGNTPILPVDHKTSSRRGMTNEMSNQFMGYCWMLSTNNIMVNKIGLQKTVKPKDKFERPIISYAPSVIDAWINNSVWWIKHILDCEERGVWPQNLTSCDKYNSVCQFYDVCKSPTESREHTLSSLYDIRTAPWDVAAAL
jgi:PD-(D/E)XK nuclease superfamily